MSVSALDISPEVDVSGFNVDIENSNVLDGIFIGSNLINFSSTVDCWGENLGVGLVSGSGFNGADCTFNLSVGDMVYVGEYINADSNISLLNQTGNLSFRRVVFNSTSGGFISLTSLNNLSGECYYGSDSALVKAFQIPVNQSKDFDRCNVTYFLNETSVVNGVLVTSVDNSVSLLVLATAVTGVVVITVYKAKYWDSVT